LFGSIENIPVSEQKQTASPLLDARRIVVKVGSALLVEPATGEVNRAWLETLAADIARLRARGCEVLVVSSGAIALGRRAVGLPVGRLKLEESQAAAAVGQIRLAHAWKEVLETHGLQVAQILLTLGDTEERRRYLNARSTLRTLLKLGAVPVINENDTVATAEIRYGDNDRLAARVAQMISADCLILLSDVDGLYTADPRLRPDARFIPEIRSITPEIEKMAGRSVSDVGSGGMATKIAAAKIAIAAGCHMCVALGRNCIPSGASRMVRAAAGFSRRSIPPQSVNNGSPERSNRPASSCSMPGPCGRYGRARVFCLPVSWRCSARSSVVMQSSSATPTVGRSHAGYARIRAGMRARSSGVNRTKSRRCSVTAAATS